LEEASELRPLHHLERLLLVVVGCLEVPPLLACSGQLNLRVEWEHLVLVVQPRLSLAKLHPLLAKLPHLLHLALVGWEVSVSNSKQAQILWEDSAMLLEGLDNSNRL
jgi:hypothetical protein